jgi:hypothetical protein
LGVVRPSVLNNKPAHGNVHALTDLSSLHGGSIARADVGAAWRRPLGRQLAAHNLVSSEGRKLRGVCLGNGAALARRFAGGLPGMGKASV